MEIVRKAKEQARPKNPTDYARELFTNHGPVTLNIGDGVWYGVDKMSPQSVALTVRRWWLLGEYPDRDPAQAYRDQEHKFTVARERDNNGVAEYLVIRMK
jgi:hypothetical protein